MLAVLAEISQIFIIKHLIKPGAVLRCLRYATALSQNTYRDLHTCMFYLVSDYNEQTKKLLLCLKITSNMRYFSQ